MTLLFAATELESFKQINPGSISTVEVADNGSNDDFYDTSYSRSAILVNSATSFIYVVLNSGISSGYFQFALNPSGNIGQGTDDLITIKNQAGTEVLWLKGPSAGANNNVDFQRWNGSSRTTIANVAAGQDTFIIWTIKWIIDASSGVIEVYQDGNSQASYSGDTTDLGTSLKEFYLSNCGSSAPHYSEVIIADESTIGWRVATLYPTATGANTAWTNTYSEVDDAAIADGSSISTTSTDVDESFILSDLSAVADNYEIKGVVVGARAKYDGSGPSNIDMLVYTNSTNYVNGANNIDTQTGLTTGYLPYQAVWETNPNGSVTWTDATVNGLQTGVRSLT